MALELFLVEVERLFVPCLSIIIALLRHLQSLLIIFDEGGKAQALGCPLRTRSPRSTILNISIPILRKTALALADPVSDRSVNIIGLIFLRDLIDPVPYIFPHHNLFLCGGRLFAKEAHHR